MRADRLLQIVTLLRRHGRLSARDLAARLEVTQRTVLRDMEALSAAGVPVYAERGRSGGFALLPGYRPAVEELTATETQALLLSGTGAVGRMGLTTTLSNALRKVSSTLAPELTSAAERAATRIVVDPGGWFGQDDAEAEPASFAVVQRGALGDQRLLLSYRPRNATSAHRRTVDPYGLLQAGRSWYLVAAHRGRPHTFRIDRIEEAALLDEPSRRPPDLDLRGLWRQLRSEYVTSPGLTVRVEIVDGRPNEATILLAAVGSGTPRLDPGPPMVLEVEVLAARTAVAALAGLGARVRVLEPPEVVTALRRTLADATALYA